MYEAYLWDSAVVTAQQKLVLLGGLYGAYLVVGKSPSDITCSEDKGLINGPALILTADMYARLLKRVEPVGERKKLQ